MLDRARYRLGLGTYSLTGEKGTELLVDAIESGYWHLDTARLYGNESEVGDAIDAASVDRNKLLIATKVAHFEEPDPTPEYVETAVAESRDRLGVDTIDLLYHHWPHHPDEIDVVLPVLAVLRDRGVIDRIGVSNYRIEDIKRATNLIDAPIAANQVEMHPLLQQDDIYEACQERNITVIAYAPLAQRAVFEVPELAAIADNYGVTPATVSLAWLLSREGVAAIPHSSDPDHIAQNLTARELTLEKSDRERITNIPRAHRCEDPEWMSW